MRQLVPGVARTLEHVCIDMVPDDERLSDFSFPKLRSISQCLPDSNDFIRLLPNVGDCLEKVELSGLLMNSSNAQERTAMCRKLFDVM